MDPVSLASVYTKTLEDTCTQYLCIALLSLLTFSLSFAVFLFNSNFQVSPAGEK